jgi:hypothetical protein
MQATAVGGERYQRGQRRSEATEIPHPFAGHLSGAQGLRLFCKSSEKPTGKEASTPFRTPPAPDNFRGLPRRLRIAFRAY